MNWKITTQPEAEPVSLSEAKLHLRVSHDDEDDLIGSLISAARKWCEDYQGRSYVTRTITAKVDEFGSSIDLPRPPIQSVTSVKYTDSDGTEITVDSDDYEVDTIGDKVISDEWPDEQLEVAYVAGYGDAADVPDLFKAAIKLIVGHLYENREQVTSLRVQDLPMGVVHLLDLDRRF